MNLHRMLAQRDAAGEPLRIGLIGAGKFGTMFLAQARRTPGLHLLAVADLEPRRAQAALTRTGWTPEQIDATSFGDALKRGSTHVTEDAAALIGADGLDIVIDATGVPAAGIRHALASCDQGKHIVMVNVEADALAGPLLARRAREAGVVYSLAYGDQPALICELVDWARAAGFSVVAAGKGTKYLPGFHESTPATVWQHYGFTPEQVARGDFNSQMFNSFLDGTKSAIEMTAVANATGLTPPRTGLAFPPCGVDDLPCVLRPRRDGGQLDQAGTVEVVSSLTRDGRPVFRDLRWGVYVTIVAEDDYVARCFKEYGLVTDDTGSYAAMYKPYHLIGLELGISVASVGVRREPTGSPTGFRADAVAVAKRDLESGEMLDGEGGYTVYGRIMPAADSLAQGALPIGLAQHVRLRRAVVRDDLVHWNDVDISDKDPAVRVRRKMEVEFSSERSEASFSTVSVKAGNS